MNHHKQQSEEQFARALRRIAAAGPQGAPAELASRLRGAFRDHHSRRRRGRMLKIAALAACLIAAAGGTWLVTRASRPPLAQQATAAPPAALAPAVPAAQPAPAPRPAAKAARRSAPKSLPSRRAIPLPANPPGATLAAMGDFMVLPSFDPAIPVERAQIVRVEVPGQSLNLLGIPVSDEVFDQRIVADFAVAQDGRPYAVRFVQGYK